MQHIDRWNGKRQIGYSLRNRCVFLVHYSLCAFCYKSKVRIYSESSRGEGGGGGVGFPRNERIYLWPQYQQRASIRREYSHWNFLQKEIAFLFLSHCNSNIKRWRWSWLRRKWVVKKCIELSSKAITQWFMEPHYVHDVPACILHTKWDEMPMCALQRISENDLIELSRWHFLSISFPLSPTTNLHFITYSTIVPVIRYVPDATCLISIEQFLYIFGAQNLSSVNSTFHRIQEIFQVNIAYCCKTAYQFGAGRLLCPVNNLRVVTGAFGVRFILKSIFFPTSTLTTNLFSIFACVCVCACVREYWSVYNVVLACIIK